MTDKCVWDKNCQHVPTMVPKLYFPAQGWKLSAHTPIQMIMDAPCCGPCLKKMKVSDFVGPELDGEKNNIRQILTVITRDKQPVDYDRAYIEGVPLASKEYRDYKRATEKKNETQTDG